MNKSVVTTSTVMPQREQIIESTAVRLMKARKIMTINELVTGIAAEIRLFEADENIINKRIENLIDRGFLERSPEDVRTLIYKP